METLGDHFKSPVLSVDHATSILESANFMRDNKSGYVLVKEGEEYVGVVTDADFTRKVAAENLDPKSTKVSEIMSTPLFTLDASLPMIDANEQMGEKGVRHVSITENGKIVGMVTAQGLLAYYLKMFRFMQ
ncbi:MAG: CBS domain-containing protein [Nitrospina sp.]|jgi:signal-transduction protein with cAMP-binding, CBS, and nucleotidyltransferase domain|nr:CBS domain-containing protein [Nitrospina sp.]MBT3508055.1 CBS domain-containing protein [Nitrospina sp.]MBT3876582.1 CBS domain-containing protein [Nitrospina sp.]MBT4049601.1 CBS domain-containing protein [Nitrospina sp.]MBT4558313.1 CBS domain-containing protein [Nitrospina sp.]